MASFGDMTIEELKDYISSVSDNPIDVEEAEEFGDIIDDLDEEEKKTKLRALPFSRYFGEMNLTRDQIQARLELASLLKEVIATTTALIAIQQQFGQYGELMATNQLASEYARVAQDFLSSGDAEWLSRYTQQYATDYVKATFQHGNDKWFTSDDRATFNAENEANTILNHGEFTNAQSRGYYHKQWLTMEDSRVRDTHRAIDRQIIPIDDFFRVGDASMLYPKDVDNASDFPEEYVNCRCSIKYLP